MPGEDGYTFLRKLRAMEAESHRPPIPAAALTAYTREQEIHQALEAGFLAHLAKPIDEKALLKALTSMVVVH
jgi:CheY-like chemotaxis protein